MIAALLLLGCAPPIADVEVQVLDDMATLVEVRWTTRKEVASTVRFGTDGQRPLETPTGPVSTTHSAILRGLPQDTAATLQVTTADGDEGEVVDLRTGALDDAFLPFTLEGDPLDEFVIAPLYDPGDSAGVVILDGQGRVVWQHEDERELYVTRARLARDGSGIIYNSSDLNGEADEIQTLIWVSWTGEETRTVDVPLMGHDFVEKADGTVVTLAFEERDEIVGTKLVEVAPDGTQTDSWSAFDCFDPDETSHDEMARGWTFANALDYDEAADRYTISFRNFGSLVSVDGATGACDWVLGGLASTVDITGETFEHQHQFVRTEDAVLVFDNDGMSGASRILEYALSDGGAEEIWSHEFDQWNVVLGDVHRLPNDERLVVWAVHGQIDRVTASGEMVSTLATEPGVVVGFVDLPSDLYTERTGP
jgi:hypothetical protein